MTSHSTRSKRQRQLLTCLLGVGLIAQQGCRPDYLTCAEVPSCAEAMGGAGTGGELPSGAEPGPGTGASNGSGGAADDQTPSGGSAPEQEGDGGAASAKPAAPSNGDGTEGLAGASNEFAEGGAPAGGNTSEGDPLSCEQDADCPGSGACRRSFRDEDGDGYGLTTTATGRCDGSIPAGFAAFDGDCCDHGGNLALAAEISPGQAGFFETPANICGIDWDYDCSGQVEGKSPVNLGCGTVRDAICTDDADLCQRQTRPTTIDDCGKAQTSLTCYCQSDGPGVETCEQASTGSAGRSACH